MAPPAGPFTPSSSPVRTRKKAGTPKVDVVVKTPWGKTLVKQAYEYK
jgi:hypothetical protein